MLGEVLEEFWNNRTVAHHEVRFEALIWSVLCTSEMNHRTYS